MAHAYSASRARSQEFRSGFVALVGRPNAGKSTLLNACMGEKRAIVSPHAQTTRRRMRAVVHTEHVQIVFVDTPGLHKPKDTLGKELNKSALATLHDVDVVAMLIDGSAQVGSGDAWVARHLATCPAKKILVISKADMVDQDTAMRQIAAASELCTFDDVIVLSAHENFNVDAFIELISQYVPRGPKWFPDDMDCDASPEELAAEFVREQVLLTCRQELPHAVGVICTAFEQRSNGSIYIQASITVERSSQRAIILGHQGSMIRRIGSAARLELERLFEKKVYLELEVEVRPHWRRSEHEIRRFGYSLEE